MGAFASFYKDVECFLQDEHVDANFDDEISTYLYTLLHHQGAVYTIRQNRILWLLVNHNKENRKEATASFMKNFQITWIEVME